MDRTASSETGASQAPGFSQLFYVDADTSGGWPEKAAKTLCKLGVTTKAASARCSENEYRLQNEFGVEGEMAVVFEACGFIAEVETAIVKATRPWACEHLEGAPSTEWRMCRPRQLARVVVLLTRRIASMMSRRFEGTGLDLQIIREPVPPMPEASPGPPDGGPLPLNWPRPGLHPTGL